MGSVKRVLVVDDDDTIRDMIAMALCDEGYEVGAAQHGADALGLLAKWLPDLILLDMRMPVMDGWEFSRTYREGPGQHAPIVVLTAGRDAATAAAQIGADGFLAKPFDLEKLLTLVAEMLNGGPPTRHTFC